MLGRIFAVLLIVLGLGTAGAGIASGTVWRPDEVVTATLPQDPEVPVVLAPGHVLATVNPDVTVTVSTADGETPVVLAMGRAADVRAWVADAPAVEITGLTDWETLSVEQVTADPTEEPSEDASADPSESPSDDAEGAEGESSDAETTDGGAEAETEMPTVPDPRGSDLWIEELSDTGELTYEWSQVEGDWLMLVATDGSTPAPTVSLTWQREVTTPLMVPGIIVGGVLFLIGLVWLVILLLMAREEKQARRRAAESEAEDAALAMVSTVAEDGTPLTRRQLREAARAAEEKQRTGAIAVSEGADPSEDGSTEDTDTTEGTDTTEDGATDLAAWVNAGRKDAAPDDEGSHGEDALPEHSSSDSTEEADSGDGLDENGSTADASDPAAVSAASADDAEADGAEVDDADPSGTKEDTPRRRWWQFGRARHTGDAADHHVTEESGSAGLGDFSTWGAPTIGAAAADGSAAAGERVDTPRESSETEDGAADPGATTDSPEEHNPQASGASWRQTWGLHRAAPETQPEETPTDGDEEDQR